jgi:(S)-sulfolactate dehydrogenase
MAKLVVSEYLPDGYIDLLQESHELIYDPDLYADRPRLLAELGDAEGIFIRNRTRIDRELIVAAPRMRVVGRLGVGLDNIDMDACEEAGIRVIPAVGANAVSVAEYVMGAMLILVRGIYGMTGSMVAGEWPRQGHAFGHELEGKLLGLIGLGSIARQVVSRAAAFGMRVAAFDPYLPADDPIWETVKRMDLDRLLSEADVVSLHTPLDTGTRGLIDATALARMRPSAMLINTSRGGVVDEPALATALRRGELGGAALDVFSVEPLGPGPAAVFADVPNLLLTPHLAGNTEESVDRVAKMVVTEVLDALHGEDG